MTSPATMIHNIFTEKTVGLAFAAAFALWAWMLNNLAGTIMEGVDDIRSEQVQLKGQIADLRSSIVTQQIELARSQTELRERQNGVLHRLTTLEKHLDLPPGGRNRDATRDD